MNELLYEAAAILRESRRIIVFSGAGISAESGIPTFRDDAGFWIEFPPEHFATWGGLVRSAVLTPRRFARFLHAVVGPIAYAEPNAAHHAIAAAEQHTSLTVVTQNIDALHQQAGSTLVHEVHGTFFETVTLGGRFNSCVGRGRLRRTADHLLRASHGLFATPRSLFAMRPTLGIGIRGVYRPNLVMFGDKLAEPAWSNAQHAVEECDCLVQVGTSGAVMPAALLPLKAAASGAAVIAIDPEPTEADIWLRGNATEVVPPLFDTAFGDEVSAAATA